MALRNYITDKYRSNDNWNLDSDIDMLSTHYHYMAARYMFLMLRFCLLTDSRTSMESAQAEDVYHSCASDYCSDVRIRNIGLLLNMNNFPA